MSCDTRDMQSDGIWSDTKIKVKRDDDSEGGGTVGRRRSVHLGDEHRQPLPQPRLLFHRRAVTSRQPFAHGLAVSKPQGYLQRESSGHAPHHHSPTCPTQILRYKPTAQAKFRWFHRRSLPQKATLSLRRSRAQPSLDVPTSGWCQRQRALSAPAAVYTHCPPPHLFAVGPHGNERLFHGSSFLLQRRHAPAQPIPRSPAPPPHQRRHPLP